MDQHEGNDDFIRQNAAAIAQLLLSRESSEDKIVADATELYRILCFDEPILEGDYSSACRDLCRELLSGKLALSNRFVSGVLYYHRNGDNPIMAMLAYAVLIKVPLACSQTNDLSMIRQYLGSYKGLEIVSPVSSDNDDDGGSSNAPNDGDGEKSSKAPNDGDGGESSKALTDGIADDRYENDQVVFPEVWAEESDPSDYGYGDGAACNDHLGSEEDWDDCLIDPASLSKPDLTLTYSQGQTAMTSLLQHANYSILAPLFERRDDKVIQELTQITLTLLTTAPSSWLDGSMKAQGLYPLWLIRDSAMHRKSCVAAYLEVLQTLLAIDDAQQGQANSEVASATIVGFTALSAWCAQDWNDAETQSHNYPLTYRCIVESMNELSHVLEKSLVDKETNIQNLNHLRNNLIPVMEVVTNIDLMGRARISESALHTASSFRKQAPQVLLNSGLFRLLLELVLNDDSAPERLRIESYHSLLFLCVMAPTILGRYAFRYPGFAAKVLRLQATTSSNLVQSILWNALGTILVSESPNRITWKSKNAKDEQLPLSVEECRQTCRDGWELLCLKASESLESVTQNSTVHSEALQTLEDLERFTNILVSCSALCEIFTPLADDSSLRSLCGTLLKLPIEFVAAPPKEKEEAGSDEVLQEDVKPRRSIQAVANTRKVLKQLTLLFQASSNALSKTD
jgi:hypothetical protein